MNEPKNIEDFKQTVPEMTNYKWEAEGKLSLSKARQLLKNRIAHTHGTAQQVYTNTLTALEGAWQKHGFDTVPTQKLKKLLIAAAKDLNWHHTNHAPHYRKPEQPADPTLKTCSTCNQTKPKSHFMRSPTTRRARQYGWREDTRIKIPHERCNYCASPKRKNLKTKYTTPSIAKLRKQINETLKVARRMQDSAYKELKIKLLESCRERVCDYLLRGVRGPDEWHMMLNKEERTELEALHRRVHWNRRTPAVF